jgi:hypothetical protein
MSLNQTLLYFCLATVVLFFRRLCSEPPEMSIYNTRCEMWWVTTVALVVAWPVLAPLAGAYCLGVRVRDSIEKHNKSVDSSCSCKHCR